MIVNTPGEIVQSGPSYEETTLWSGSEYQTNTELELSSAISNYNQIIMRVKRTAAGYADQLTNFFFPVTDLVGTTCGLFGYVNGDYLYIEATSTTKFTIKAGYTAGFSIVKIIGVSY